MNSCGLTFFSGQSVSNMPTQCTDLVIINDDILEVSETFSIRLVSRSSKVIIASGREQAEVVIMEDSIDRE